MFPMTTLICLQHSDVLHMDNKFIFNNNLDMQHP